MTTALAWVVILVLCAGWMTSHRGPMEESEGPSTVPFASQLAGRLVMAAKQALRGWHVSPEMLLQNGAPLAEGEPVERIAYAILVAAVDSPERGLARLEALVPLDDPSADLAEADRVLAEAVRTRLARWIDGASSAERALPPAEAERLGYFADVLAGGVAPSSAVLLWLVLFGGWYLVAALAGVALLLLLLVAAALGLVRSRLTVPSGRGGVYAETFAVWMLLFFGNSALLGLAGRALDVPHAAFLAALVAMFGSLAALGWPVLRGVPFGEVRKDVGLEWGRGPLRETLAGFGAYSIALPLLFLGAIVMILLTRLVDQGGAPSHPAVEGIGAAGPGGLVLVFLLACIAAPIVEETMFRGVLYRHLRDATGRAGTALSFAASALVTSVLFAAIHPQGLLFIPVLAGLAIGFCIARELRGSLWPGMVAHAITNFVTLSLNVVLWSA